MSDPTSDGLAARVRRTLRAKMRDSGLDGLTLRWRFRVVVMAFAVPFLGYVVWSAVQQAELAKHHVREQARTNAILLAARLDDHIEQIDRLLATAAQSIGSDMTDVARIDGLVQGMRSFVPRAVTNISVWRPDGANVTALDRRTHARGVNVADRQYFRDVLTTRDFAFEGPIRSRASGATFVQFARPIFGPDDRIVGVLTMGLAPDELVAMLDKTPLVSGAMVATIVNRDGAIVARSIDAGDATARPVLDADSVRALFESRTGTREDAGGDGQRRLVGYAAVGHWPWVVTVGEPLDEVLGAVSARLLRALGIGLAIFAVAFVVAGRVAAWTTRPLLQLATDTERLRAGDLASRSDVVSGGEIAALAANFNSMAASIEERERALAASRQQLRAIADNVPAQIFYIDRDERYRFVNAHRGAHTLTGADDMIGRTVREVRGDAFYASIAAPIRRALHGTESFVEVERTIDGQTLWSAHHYVPDRADDGAVHGVYCFVQDITERKRAELERAESERRLVTITDNLPALICYVDDQRRFRFASRAFETWYRRPLAEIIGRSFDCLMPPEVSAKYDTCFLRGMNGESVEYEFEVELPDRGSRWLRSSFLPDFDPESGRPRGVYGMTHDVTQAKHAEQRLLRLAQYDTLTGIANRNQFNETLAAALERHDEGRGPLALMFLDIDHFKQVNDRHGHASGDVLLKEFAQRLVDNVRPTDAVARLSGDEFVVLLEGMHSDEEAQFIARKIIAAVEKPFAIESHPLHVTASIGIAVRVDANETASALMKRADEALYEAKRGGRNTVRLAG